MRLFIAVTIAWLIVAGIGAGGLLAGQGWMAGVCLAAWTPAAIAWGYAARSSGVRLTVSGEQFAAPAPRQQIKPLGDPVRRKRIVE